MSSEITRLERKRVILQKELSYIDERLAELRTARDDIDARWASARISISEASDFMRSVNHPRWVAFRKRDGRVIVTDKDGHHVGHLQDDGSLVGVYGNTKNLRDTPASQWTQLPASH